MPGETATPFSLTAAAGPAEVNRAVSAARRGFEGWSTTPPRERAEILLSAAEILRRDRFDLAAIEVFECGKPWREADADVAEAIDFCEFYAREMIRLAEPQRRDVPGETNAIEKIPRGVVVVIPPWNFPLAIPMGMTAAALVDRQRGDPQASRAIAGNRLASLRTSFARPAYPREPSSFCRAGARSSARRWWTTPGST